MMLARSAVAEVPRVKAVKQAEAAIALLMLAGTLTAIEVLHPDRDRSVVTYRNVDICVSVDIVSRS